ncbi:MAG: Hsp70 family protein [Actinomycetota bacterium]|nr:Hsp70 family protein [Actinomycetota bacterium]
MGYTLGIDLGTTFTAAALLRDGRTEVVALGNHAATIPSMVFLREDDNVLVGDAAERRGQQEPARLAREFKRRLGDSVPILLDRTPFSAERLMAVMLRQIVADISARQGAAPDRVAVSHPANWGQFKIDLLRQAVELAGLGAATFVTEPVAAAVQYASTERVDVGDIIAVYDLGGGTFDAAILRKTADGFETLGRPQGIERLDGIDFDEAVIAHVRRTVGDVIAQLDSNDPSARAALARLRHECVLAKETLSSDSDATVPVLLPNVQTQVRITRTEFEDMIRPLLRDTIESMRRALESAGVRPSDVKSVLLSGGSSRIPLVSEMVRAELGRPVVTDSHPKHSVALGAARLAQLAQLAQLANGAAAAAVLPAPGLPTRPLAVQPSAVLPAAAPASPEPAMPARPTSPAGSAPEAAAAAAALTAAALTPAALTPAAAAAPSTRVLSPITQQPPQSPPTGSRAGGRSQWMLLAGGIAAAALLVVVLVFAFGRGDDAADGSTTPTVTSTSSGTLGATVPVSTDGSQVTTATTATGATTVTNATSSVTDPAATTATTAATPTSQQTCNVDTNWCVGIISVEWDVNGVLQVNYNVQGFVPEDTGVDGDLHVHFFWSSVPPDAAGMPFDGPWYVWDLADGGGQYVFDGFTVDNVASYGYQQNDDLCIIVADSQHRIAGDLSAAGIGTYYCLPNTPTPTVG